MKLSSLIEKESILVKTKINSREEAIKLAVDSLYEKKKIPFPKSSVIEEIKSRDQLGGTVFKNGMAIPHARIKDYGDLSIVLCIPENPVEVEETQVSCFVVMITSLAVSNLYLQVLATLAKLSQDSTIFNNIKASKNSEEVHNILEGIYVKKELTVEDLMHTEYGIAEPDMNLKELTDLFYTNKTSYLPVISGNGEFLGEVRVNDLISVGIPDYAVSIGNLSFMKSFAPLEKLLIEEESIPVRNIMKKSLVSLSPESSVVEAVMKMTQGNFRHLPVIKDGKLVGILNVMDILYKVLRR